MVDAPRDAQTVAAGGFPLQSSMKYFLPAFSAIGLDFCVGYFVHSLAPE